jgi:hypothetical protein
MLLAACGGQTSTGGSSSSDSGARRDAETHRDAGNHVVSLDSGALDASEDNDTANEDAGALNVGSPCNTDRECHPASVNDWPLACLGGEFTGGYCAVVPAECSGGGCPSGTACVQEQGTTDIDGGTFNTGDLCVKVCGNQGECRTGYLCCNAGAGMGGMNVCVPPSLCLQGG